MFKWKWEVIENRIEYKLVLEDDEEEVVGSVIAIEEGDEKWTIKAECEEIGYKEVEERVDKKLLKTMVANMKKFIKEELEKIEELR